MKFPLASKVFPDVRLTSDECIEYEQLAHFVLEEAMDEFEHFNHQQRRHLGASQWKAIKSQENVTVYRERGTRRGSSGLASLNGSRITTSASTSSSQVYDFMSSGRGNVTLTLTPLSSSQVSRSSSVSTTYSIASGVAEASERLLPKLVAVGTVPGTIEDMVYGMASPKAGLAMVKAAYTKDEVVDTEVLYEMQGPTPEHPLRFVGLKWLVKGHSSGISALVRPRDFVYLENSGIQTRPDGSRMGYVVMHSVELPECRELAEHSIVRGRFSLCFLFRQLRNGTVDVFMKSFVDLSGNLGDSVAIRTSTKILISFSKAIICAQNKKIAWALFKKRHHIATKTEEDDFAAAAVSSSSGRRVNSSMCSVCTKAFSKFASISSCQLCDVLMCSKCRDERKLTILPVNKRGRAARKSGKTGKEVVQETVVLCRSCVTECIHADATDVAREEILNGQYGSVQESATTTTVALRSSPRDVSSPLSVRDLLAISEEVLSLPTMKSAHYIDFGKNVMREQASPEKDESAKGLGGREPRTISFDTVSSSNVSTEDLSDLVDLLASDPAAAATTTTALSSRKKTLDVDHVNFDLVSEYEDDDEEDDEDDVIELEREDGEWTYSGRGGYALGPMPPVSGQMYNERELYQRITELNHAAESVYQYTKRTTETLLSSSRAGVSAAPGPSTLTPPRVGVDEELD